MTPSASEAATLERALEGPRLAGLLQDGLLIDGSWRAPASGERLAVTDPATGIVVAEIACANAAEVLEAITSARAATDGWAKATATERADVLMTWRDLVLQATEELAVLLTAEQGKPLGEARGEISYSAAFIRWYAEECRRSYGEIIPTNRSGRRLLAVRQPVGVVAAVTPWNFPALMIARKVAPAIAAGCGVVLKPASEAPLSALALAELGRRAGLPPGVFNVVHGDPAVVGPVLVASPEVRMLTFTGSTEVGRLLMAQCAPTVKRLALELGGNAPFIVFSDADLDTAVPGAIEAKFRNGGQTCTCANRFYVHEAVRDEFIERFCIAVRALRVGAGFEEGVAVGPLIHDRAMDKVERHVRDAVSRGASVVTGGRRHPRGGTFFEPTVLVDVDASMEVTQAETFGPVAPIITFREEHEVVSMANATESGLTAYFYTRDLARAVRISEALDFGVIGVNTGSISYEGAPFGGVKQSGLGREGSRHGLDEFTELKYLCIDGI